MALQSSSVRVLVVDDDAMSRELLAVLLEGEGYAVDSAESGEAALVRLSETVAIYDLILADMHMPGIAGAELAAELRRVCGAVPLLLAISGSEPAVTDIALFDGFLMKPFRMGEVAAALLKRGARSRVGRREKSQADRHKSRMPRNVSNAISIAASAAQMASNKGMDTSVQEHRFEAKKINEQEAGPAGIVSNGDADHGPVLNETIYRQLAGSMPAAQMLEMYALCVNDARQRIVGMRALAANRDGVQFVREAHAIKGGCGMLGAAELHRLAAALETHGLAPGPQGKTQDVNSLDELSAACDRLERMLGSSV
jgi:CheY-like chemotaxis protein